MDIEAIDLGDEPPAIGGAKTFTSSADEAIVEAPLMWGSRARVRVSARIKVAGFVLYIPVEVTNIQVVHPAHPPLFRRCTLPIHPHSAPFLNRICPFQDNVIAASAPCTSLVGSASP